jgi:hypothetical protein
MLKSNKIVNSKRKGMVHHLGGGSHEKKGKIKWNFNLLQLIRYNDADRT